MKTQTKIHKAAFGMAPYVAPELFVYDNSQHPPFSKKTDIYSLGVLLWEISSGYPPFKSEDYSDIALIYNVTHGTREKMIPDTPPDYHELYTDCWNEDPNKRPIIDKVYYNLKSMLPKNNEIIEDKDKTEDSKGNFL